MGVTVAGRVGGGGVIDCEQSLFCSKIRRENERDGMRDIRAASGEAASRE